MKKVEQYIKEHTNRYSNHVELAPYITGFTEWLTPDQARSAIEIARKEIYDWLENNLALYDACDSFLEKCRLLKDLKKAMKDE